MAAYNLGIMISAGGCCPANISLHSLSGAALTRLRQPPPPPPRQSANSEAEKRHRERKYKMRRFIHVLFSSLCKLNHLQPCTYLKKKKNSSHLYHEVRRDANSTALVRLAELPPKVPVEEGDDGGEMQEVTDIEQFLFSLQL